MPDQILLHGHPRLSRLFQGRPVRVLLRLATPGVLLVVFAEIIQIASLPGTTRKGAPANFGYFFAWNWSLMYSIVLPVIFLGFAILERFVARSLGTLEEAGVVRCSSPASGVTAASVLRDQLQPRSTGLIALCTLLAALTIYVDTLDLTSGYYFCGSKEKSAAASVTSSTPACTYTFLEEDWTVAFLHWKANHRKESAFPSFSQNLFFVIAAYSLEAFVIFLGFFWVGKVWHFLFCFSDLLENSASGFDLRPDLADPYKRFGLYPIGLVYDAFLSLVLVFECYVFGHRLQLVKARGGLSVSDYVAYLAEHFKHAADWLKADFNHFDTMSSGEWMLILGISLPMVTVCWLPLFKLRRYLIDMKLRLAAQFRSEREKAKTSNDTAAIESLSKQILAINGFSVWPNGDTVGLLLLWATLIMWISAVVPAVFVALVLAVVIPALVALWRRLAKGGADTAH